jgi:hypothetical protein
MTMRTERSEIDFHEDEQDRVTGYWYLRQRLHKIVQEGLKDLKIMLDNPEKEE